MAATCSESSWMSPPRPSRNPVEDLLALDEALTRFEQQWPDKAKLVKLKYFAGLTIPEASEATGVSTATLLEAVSIRTGGSSS